MKRLKVAASVVGLVALVGVLYVTQHTDKGTEGAEQADGPPGGAVSGLPPVGAPVHLTPPAVLGVPTLFIDVRDPGSVATHLAGNAWLQQTIKTPLGRGFLGQWSAAFETLGADLGASFSGTIGQFLAEQLLTSPARLAWFTGEDVSPLPVVIIPDPAEHTKTAYMTMRRAVQRGSFLTACPAPEVKGQEPRQAALNLTIERWLVAERTLYVALQEGRLVLGPRPEMVVHGLCAPMPAVEAGAAAIDVTLFPTALGRPPQLLANLLGLGDSAHLLFDITDAGELVPRGLAATLAQPTRLDKAALSAPMLKVLPEDAPVMVAMQLRLPATLDKASLKANLSAPQAGGKTRQAAVIWYPSGRDAPPALALAWSEVGDKAALQEAFSGSNPLFWQESCGVLVAASTHELAQHLQAVCAGSQPSVLHASQAVAQGWQQPLSLALGLHSGPLLVGLMRDAYEADLPAKAPLTLPPELRQAAEQLGALPYWGLAGAVDQQQLQPAGFRG